MLDEFVIDDRMRYALLVSPDDVELAAAEIKRHGSDPRVCSVSLTPTGDKYFGDRYYHPIYDAAVEHGLPIMTHACGFRSGGSEAYVEEWINRALGAAVQVNSLVTQGTFERYPTLKVMIVEHGFPWIVPLMWRTDGAWRRNRRELPWLKRWPSEYMRDHIRLSTQPLDDESRPDDLYRMIEESYLSEMIVYSSDYPHWDNDRPGAVLNKLSDDTKRKVFCDNAKGILRL
jgi:predicted TIM-barrel fold metal-dependent hydrolase